MKYLSLFIVSLLLIAQPLSLQASSKVNFKQSQIQTDFKITHPIKTANLLGLEVEQMVVIGESEENQRLLVVYELLQENNQYVELSRIIIPNNYLAYDLLKTKDISKLIFQTKNSLMEYNPAKNRFNQLAEIQSIYLQTEAAYLAEKDFINDLNGDELDDIALVDFDGVHFLLQTETGEFKRQLIPIKPKMQTNENNASFTETPLFFGDMNLDQKPDLILIKDQALSIYPQNPDGTFALTPIEMILPIDVREKEWWELKEADGSNIDQSKISHRSMYKITDINNDQLVDLVVKFSQTDGMLDRQNNYEIYFAKHIDGKIEYQEKPNNVISSEGTIAGIEIVDLDQDKKSEIMVASLDIGVSQIIGALLSGSIDQDIYVFKMDDADQFKTEPNVEKEVELEFSLSSGKSDDPIVRLADFNGDGIKDLLFSDGKKTLRVYQGNSGNKLFDKRASKHKIQLPNNGKLLVTSDLNNDGKQDMIIRYDRRDDEKLKHQLVFLFAS